MKEIRVKCSVEDYMNKQISIYEDINNLKIDIEQENVDMDDVLDRLNALNFGAIGVEEEVLCSYFRDIAKRTIELNDKKLLELLEGIEIVKAD